MGIFKNVKEAKPTGNYSYFEPGHEWIVLIEQIKQDETRKGKPFIAASCRVIETTNEAVRPGASRNWWVDLTQDASDGNILNFMLAATDMAEADFQTMSEDETDAAGEALIGEEQPCANVIVGLKTFLNKKGTFTIHDWQRLSNDTFEAYAAKAKELGILSGEALSEGCVKELAAEGAAPKAAPAKAAAPAKRLMMK